MGNRGSRGAPGPTIIDESPCSKCVVSNKSTVLALLIFIVFLGVLEVILIWAMGLTQTMQIVTSVFAAVMFVLALAGASLPYKCSPCMCVA